MASLKNKFPQDPQLLNTQLLTQLFAHTSDLVIVLDKSFHIEFINPAAKIFFKIPTSQVLGKSWAAFLGVDNFGKLQEAAKKIAHSRSQLRLEVDFIINHLPVMMDMAVVPRFENKVLVGYFVNLRDVSHERQIQELISESQKMEALQYFVSGTTKEIQYPLLAILKKIEGFESKYHGRSFEYVSYKEFDQIMNFLKVIHKQIATCYDTTAKLTNLNKKRLKFESHHCSGNDVIREVVRAKEADPKNGSIKFRLKLSDQIPFIAIGEIEFNEIISHLIDNALHAMPGGGHLSVVTSKAVGGHEVRVDIADEGVGISPEDLPHIFEPFFTTKQRAADRSVGLGLSIVYSLVKSGHGQIKVKSSLRKGTTVQITFPAAEAHPQPPKVKK